MRNVEKGESATSVLVRQIKSRNEEIEKLDKRLASAQEIEDFKIAREIEEDLDRMRLLNDRAWTTIINQHTPGLTNFLRKKFSSFDEDTLKDLVQETCIRAVTKIDQFNFRSTFKTWLYTIGRNLGLNMVEKNKRTPSIIGLLFRDSSRYEDSDESDGDDFGSPPSIGPNLEFGKTYDMDDPESFAIMIETARQFDESVKKLPEKLRVAFILCDLKRKTYQEIAEITNTKDGTVRSRINRARTKIFDDLGISSRKPKTH